MATVEDGKVEKAVVGSSAPHGSAWLITLRNEIDLDNISRVRDAVAAMREEHRGPVVFEVRDLAFCDSSLLNVLLRLLPHHRVALAGPCPWLERLTDMTGVTPLLPTHPGLDEALRSLER